MKLHGLLMLGPDEPLLQASLNDFDRLRLDAVNVTLNNVDAATKNEVQRRGYIYHEDDRDWGKQQPAMKHDAVLRLKSMNPDWVLAKDADELLDPRLSREGLEALTASHQAYRFYYTSLWDDEFTWMPDLSGWRTRFYRLRPDLSCEVGTTPVHCPLAPTYARRVSHKAPYRSMHYGFINALGREARLARYARYDPDQRYAPAAYYAALTYENGASLRLDDNGIPITPRPS